MSDVFSPAPGGPSAPGALPWFAPGGAPASTPGADQASSVGREVVHVTYTPFGSHYVTTYTEGPPEVRPNPATSWYESFMISGKPFVLFPKIDHRMEEPGPKYVAQPIWDKPGPLGFVVGAILPFTTPLWFSASAGAAVAIGGYASPAGSPMRRFSIGFGLGGGLAFGIQAARFVMSLPSSPTDIFRMGAEAIGGAIQEAIAAGIDVAAKAMLDFGAFAASLLSPGLFSPVHGAMMPIGF